MTDYDLVIVGGGLMGAGVARAVRDADPGMRIGIVDAGSPIGAVPGLHLHDTDDDELWLTYNRRVEAGTQALYVGADTTPSIGATAVGAAPGIYHLSSFGEDASDLPGAAVAWNAGGMGVHWTAATPHPYGSEVFDFLDPAEWDADLARALELLQVHPDPYGQDDATRTVAEQLRKVFDPDCDEGRRVQPMPMAVQPAADGTLRRTGPGVIFPALTDGTDPNLDYLLETLAVAVEFEGDRATAVRVRDLRDGSMRRLTATQVVVCADAMRTPQLLHASGVRLPALGRHLNEHVFVSGRVFVDLARVPMDLSQMRLPRTGEWCVGSLWLPHSDERQPFQGQIMTSLVLADDLRTPLGYAVQLSWYIPTGIDPDNRVEFAEGDSDAAGLPKMTVRFAYSAEDRLLIEAGRAAQRRAGQALGEFDPERDSAILTPGSSLHYTGTVRMGEDPETSVCDTDGRVWGTQNLYVAGNGAIPTRMVANTTLTGMVTAVRVARAVGAAGTSALR